MDDKGEQIKCSPLKCHENMQKMGQMAESLDKDNSHSISHKECGHLEKEYQ